VLFIPCFGPLLLTAVAADGHNTWLPVIKDGPILGAAILAFAALLEHLDSDDKAGSFPLRPSVLWAAISFAGFAYAIPAFARNWDRTPFTLLSLAATFVAFFASVPLREFVRRVRSTPGAVPIVVVAAACPILYLALNEAFLRAFGDVTATGVVWVLQLVGIAGHYDWRLQPAIGKHPDQWRLVIYSEKYSADLLAPCAGMEGITFIAFLLSILLLSDWKVFSKIRHLWIAYVAIVPVFVVANALRIASIFLFVTAKTTGHVSKADSLIGTDLYHSYVGLVFYATAFAVLVPLLYRWAQSVESRR
jgi:exosortase/archaeosortase family protein